ncbi:Transcription factor steA [Grifola frondosa]|uniref:Transcription factor steA n=1 Tax=Grifola frondosa TaxID=5627 RepID=A0A1C7MIV0_GRIFR|nr:Transcription factor steA [Grifola frondosa]
MDSLVSQHPPHHQFLLDQSPYPGPLRLVLYSFLTPRLPPQTALCSLPEHPHLQSQPRFDPSASSIGTSLQIHTSTPAAHEHDPDEQTAHPSRNQSEKQPAHQQPAHQQSIVDSLTEGAGPYGGLTRPLTLQERELLAHLDRLKFFLATAPSRWSTDAPMSDVPVGHPNSAHPALNRFLLPNQEYVSCVLWGGLYHITGTDIVRALVFRFEAFGRPVRNMKKFEEGVFSDLRNLKPGVDACLEEPKSPFLDLLFKYQCIRTQKKQKVFYWFSVPHDRLFLDALERDLKREKMGFESTTVVTGEPAQSFTYDPKRSLYEQFSKAHGSVEGEGELEAAVRRADEARAASEDGSSEEVDELASSDAGEGARGGSPTYKQRRKKLTKARKSPTAPPADADERRVPEPQVDRFGRDTTRLSAAEMFRAQARGEFGTQSNPDLVASQRERQRRAMEAQAQVALAQGRLPYLTGLTGPGVSGLPSTSSMQQQQMQYPQRACTPHLQARSLPMGFAPDRPHMEQRHTYPLAEYAPAPARSNTDPYFAQQQQQQGPMNTGWTPTGEVARTKAFVCPLFSCGRMFKRMEHLKRHLRTHTLERPFQCARCRKRFSRSDNLAQHERTHMRVRADAEAEDDGMEMEGLEMEEEEELVLARGLGYGGVASVRMCEVEVQGCVHDVPGDEEGLVLPGGAEIYYDAAQLVRASPEASPYLADASPGAQWASTRLGASYHGALGEYVTSISAPAHKATFDHAALYPPETQGAGPIRRHRSATPSVARYGEPIRRPFSAAVSDHGHGHGSRGYHPYAAAAAGVGLPYGLQEQMRQMFVEPEVGVGYEGQGQVGYAGMYGQQGFEGQGQQGQEEVGVEDVYAQVVAAQYVPAMGAGYYPSIAQGNPHHSM